MSILLKLSTLALREVVAGSCRACGVGHVLDSVQRVTGFLQTHFHDHSGRLNKALRSANQRAWQTLELALAGDSFWERCKGLLASGDDKRFRREIQAHLQTLTLLEGDADRFRKLCLSELRVARKDGIFDSADLNPEELAKETGAFARFADDAELLNAERQVLAGIGDVLRCAKYETLARLIDLQPRPDTSLLTVAVRYFFRRAVEDDPKLFQGLTFAQLEQLQQGQREQFAAVHDLLTQQGDKLEGLLGELQADVFATFNAVLDVHEEQKRQAGKNDDIYQAVIQLQNRLDMMRSELRPRDSLSIRGDVERQLVKELVSRYRKLPEEQRQDMPALLNAVGKLQVAAGEFQSAQRDFAQVAVLVDDSSAKAEAHFNAYRTALERRDWPAALRELLDAAKLDAARFEPFPLRKYHPERILGAGGFGVAFQCRHQHLGSHVVIKTLTADGLDRSLTDVFAEASALRRLDHPAIIRLGDCDFAGTARSRPYLEMDYFESQSLEDHVRQHGCLGEDDLGEVARQIAEGLGAAHARGVLHRDVKPGNVLVKRQALGGWSVKLIDFGLAVGLDRMQGSTASGTLRGSSIAGTIDYAAPEQMGKLPGVAVTEASDVFGFARTCFFALFGTPYPKAKHFDKLSPKWRSLLDDCVSDDPKERPGNFVAVLSRLQESPALVATTTPGMAQTAPPPTATGKSGWGYWTDLTNNWIRGAFAPRAPGAAKTPTPSAALPPAPKVEKKPDVLEVIPMPPPTSEGIEVVEEQVLEAIPAPKPPVKPKPPSNQRTSPKKRS